MQSPSAYLLLVLPRPFVFGQGLLRLDAVELGEVVLVDVAVLVAALGVLGDLDESPPLGLSQSMCVGKLEGIGWSVLQSALQQSGRIMQFDQSLHNPGPNQPY